MAFKMKGFPMQATDSALKGLVRGIGPHNPAHKAVGDDSDDAHGTSEFKEAFEVAQAKQQETARVSEEKAKNNPNKAEIDAIRKRINEVGEFSDEGMALYDKLRELRGR